MNRSWRPREAVMKLSTEGRKLFATLRHKEHGRSQPGFQIGMRDYPNTREALSCLSHAIRQHGQPLPKLKAPKRCGA